MGVMKKMATERMFRNRSNSYNRRFDLDFLVDDDDDQQLLLFTEEQRDATDQSEGRSEGDSTLQ